MKGLKDNRQDNKSYTKLIRKAVITVVLCVIMYIAYWKQLPVPAAVTTIIRIASTVGLIYILVSFKAED